MPRYAESARRRLTALTGAIALATLGLTGAIAVGLAAPAQAAPTGQPAPVCPPDGEMPPASGNLPEFTDANVSVFVGGNMTTDDSAVESEGLHVILGNATFGTNFSDVGSVGVGSQIVPPPRSDMLLVGGDLTVHRAAGLNVGSNVLDETGTLAGGNARVGGTITGTVNQPPANDVTQHDPSAVVEWTGFGATISTVSTQLANTTATSAGVVSGPAVTFTGNGATTMQVFTVPASALNAVKEVNFVNIGKDASGAYAPIVVNVTGSDTINFAPNFWQINGGGQLGAGSPDFGNVASAVLWNFAATTNLTLGVQDQFIGSILAPQPTGVVNTNTSTNGRLYVGGDLHMSGAGVEHHNYPWTGGQGFECTVEPKDPAGGFTIVKNVAGDPGAATTEFTGTWSCDEANAAGDKTGTWHLTAGAKATVTGFPVGTACTIAEDRVTDPNGAWTTSLDPPDGKIMIAGDADVTVTVTNTFTVTRPTTSAPGSPSGTPSAPGPAGGTEAGASSNNLANTGIDVAGGLALALGLLGAGAFLLYRGRRGSHT